MSKKPENTDSHEIYTASDLFECKLCDSKFNVRLERNEHVKKHFQQRHCIVCDKSLIQLGDDWYEFKLHIDENCDDVVKNVEEGQFKASNIKVEQIQKVVNDDHMSLASDSMEDDLNQSSFFTEQIRFTNESDLDKNAQFTPVNNTVSWSSFDKTVVGNAVGKDTNAKENCFTPKQCEHCDRVITTYTDYTKHLQAQHNIRKTFDCSVCDKKFNKLQHLRDHAVSAHNGNQFSCNLCTKAFKYKNKLTLHIQIDHGVCHGETTVVQIKHKSNVSNTFSCLICNEIFNKQRDRLQHMSDVHDSNHFQCELCKKLFRFKKLFNAHIENDHDGILATTTRTNVNKSETNKLEENGPDLACPILESAADKLSRNNESDAATEENPHLSLDSSKSVGKFKPPKPCPHCDKIIKTYTGYYKHLWAAHKIKRIVKCPICNEAFDKLKHRTKHIESAHDGMRFRCEYCLKTFKKNLTWRVHVASEHLNQRFTCDICNKQVRYKDQLAKHMKVHCEREKLKCDLCDKLFIHKKSLSEHTQRIHEGKIFFECDVCRKNCGSKYNLIAHQRTHSDVPSFICSYCGHGFNQENNLKEHINIHTGEKPYACKFCEKTFTQNTQLTAHTRIHTRERPYKCKIGDCARAYINAIDLKRHRYSIHGIYTKKHICQICSKVFPEKKLLRKHMEKH